MASSSEEDDVSSDESHPDPFEEPSPGPIHVHAAQSKSKQIVQLKDSGRIPVVASAGAAAALLGAGFALTKLLRRRFSQRGSGSQPKGELISALLTLNYAHQSVRATRRNAKASCIYMNFNRLDVMHA